MADKTAGQGQESFLSAASISADSFRTPTDGSDTKILNL